MALDVNSLVTTVLQRCGRRESDTVLKAQILAEIPNLQVQLEDDPNPPKPWFLQTLADQGSWLLVPAGTSSIALPTGFLNEMVDAGLYYLYTDDAGFQKKQRLDKLSYAQFEKVVNEGVDEPDEAYPEAYHVGPTSILLSSAPTADTQFEWSYYGRDTVLDGVLVKTNQWTKYAYNLLLWKACELVASGYLSSDSMTKRFQGYVLREELLFRGVKIERELAGSKRVYGEAHES